LQLRFYLLFSNKLYILHIDSIDRLEKV
jgi:hypothetical protein